MRTLLSYGGALQTAVVLGVATGTLMVAIIALAVGFCGIGWWATTHRSFPPGRFVDHRGRPPQV